MNDTKPKCGRYLIAGAAALMAVSTFARSAEPDKKPALPAGHPDLLELTRPTTQPAGAPKLPSGHPDLSGLTQPAGADGTLAIRVVQGTKGGPAVAGLPVKVNLLQRGKAIKKIDTKLDDRGVAVVSDIPLIPQVQPLVEVVYNGVPFRAVGQVMDDSRPAQQLNVKVYEVTDQKPAWSVQARHVILHPADGGVKVMEMLAVENPADRAWLGEVQKDGSRITLTLPLPTGAQQVQYNGLADGTAMLADGKLLLTGPLPPEVSQLQYSYFLPARDGAIRLSVTAPGDVKQMTVFVPEYAFKPEVKGLEPAGSFDMEKGRALMFKGVDLKPGHEASVNLTILPGKRASAEGAMPEVDETVAQLQEPAKAPQIIAGVGGGIVLAAGTGYLLFKVPARAATREAHKAKAG
jgi:hypothetical protein